MIILAIRVRSDAVFQPYRLEVRKQYVRVRRPSADEEKAGRKTKSDRKIGFLTRNQSTAVSVQPAVRIATLKTASLV